MIERLRVRTNVKAEQIRLKNENRKLNIERIYEDAAPRQQAEAMPRQQPTRKEFPMALKAETARQLQVREAKIVSNKNSENAPCMLARSKRTYRGEDTDKFLMGIGRKKGKACERNATLRLLKS